MNKIPKKVRLRPKKLHPNAEKFTYPKWASNLSDFKNENNMEIVAIHVSPNLFELSHAI